ncbi:FMN-binding glutamate synthase family protein [Polynucleobacter sp. MWH-Aus1W21]|uniref:FMN-binding glutamate synthase family protein n=1 Tax=Polynucleobacter sp. MWH-Aus1W21 TaxID=1855880 RepID=UPI001BFD4DB9|nr:FMN-binding glutamate synthase family protein [Polynucleobacter sp. MWH-Aus1W21]QWD65710.1 FMN-binding glutamate synthase family protein [Polynucleobacter sp. MWH-Aus1W21]
MAYSRYFAWLSTLVLSIIFAAFNYYFAIFFFVLFLVGLSDWIQSRHSILRNYPLIGHLRFMLEYIRPEIRQYFLEDDEEKIPFSRNQRAMVYSRSKQVNDKRGFGSIKSMYGPEGEWLGHSNTPTHPDPSKFRIQVGGPSCLQPYSLSVFNISAMSFGALSPNAIRALNKGAKLGGFAHDTGEGSISSYHREFGGDIIWEIGSGYFGCRNPDGTFSEEKFVSQVDDPQIKMVEIKLSQGAKPGHGGVLPGPKVTAEIAATRGVPIGQDCVSPAHHSAFSSPLELMQFIGRLRKLSGGKPVGFKLCVGQPWEFFGIAKAMLETGICPDFIVVDGSEGGTGAAPVEFTDHVGMPLREGLRLVHNTLVGINKRNEIAIGASGKIISGYDIIRAIAIGADWCNSARGFMFALGCIQSRSCHTDKCPTGVATQDSVRQRALVVPDKAERVFSFHKSTMQSLAELIGAAGMTHPNQISSDYLMCRGSDGKARPYAAELPIVNTGVLIQGVNGINQKELPKEYGLYWNRARTDLFGLTPANR